MVFFLLHPAGGSSFTMKGIHDYLQKEHYSVYSIDLPGHGACMNKNLLYDFDTAVGYISRMIKNIMENIDEEFCIIGHSMGGLLAYAVEHRIEHNYDLQAKKIYILASTSPNCYACRFIKNPREISDVDLVSQVSKLGGIPESVLNSKELLGILIPILKADFMLLNSYQPRKKEGNEVFSDIVVMIGDSDKIITGKEIEGWKEYTFGDYKKICFKGNHFFYQQNEEIVCKELV